MSSDHVACEKCEKEIGSLSKDFFFYQTSGAVHFAVKPESAVALLKGLDQQPDKKKMRVKCKSCGVNLGFKLPLGPNKADVITFGTEKVRVGGAFNPKVKWKDRCASLPQVPTRDDNTFFGELIALSPTTSELPAGRKSSLRFPCNRDDLSIFDYSSYLLSDKVPRLEQVQSFIEALLKDVIIVMPTGCGKTLIASMVMRAFFQLNTERLVIFVVDRIPLVFQQANSIESDVGLKLCRLCGENKSAKILSRLKEGFYDGLVITAGLLDELLRTNQFILHEEASLIIFDECHHATGAHVYSHVLSTLSHIPQSSRPRLVGLSASPVSAQTISKGTQKLTELQTKFYGASIFKPALSITKPVDVAWKPVDPTAAQQQVVREVERHIESLARDVNRLARNEFIPASFIQQKLWHHVRGFARISQNEFYVKDKELCGYAEDILRLLPVLEINTILGPGEARELFNVIEFSKPNWPRVMWDGPSPYWGQLCEELRKCPKESKILVFVDTRESAKLLLKHLQQYAKKHFPHLVPRMVVGHGGIDGMDWEGEQEAAITEFNHGECNLIVSTSVLEEGLDVAACDLVIRFNSKKLSLIGFVQSRGRVRKENGKMVVILSREDRSVIENLESHERNLDCALEGSTRPSHDCTDIIKQLETNRPSPSTMTTSTLPSFSSKIHGATLFTIFLHGELSPSDERELGATITSSLTPFAVVKRVEYFKHRASKISSGTKIFHPSDSVVLVYLKPLREKEGYVKSLCSTWNFKIGSGNAWGAFPHVLTPSFHPFKGWKVLSTKVGHFETQRCFSSTGNLHSVNLLFIAPGKLTFSGDEGDIAIHTVNINKFAVLSSDRTKKEVTLFFSMSSAPVAVFQEDNGDGEITTTRCALPYAESEDPMVDLLNAGLLVSASLAASARVKTSYFGKEEAAPDLGPSLQADLKKLSKASAIAITLSLDDWDSFVRTLLQPTALGVPLFFGRMSVIDHVPSERHPAEFVSMDQHVLKFYEECVWSLLVFLGEKQFWIPNDTRSLIAQKINRAVKKKNVPELSAISARISQLEIFYEQNTQWEDCSRLFSSIPQDAKKGLQNRPMVVGENQILLRSVAVTPTCVVPLPPLVVQQSRLLRIFSPTHTFILVSFTDEQLQPVPSQVLVLERMKEFLKHGLNLMNRHFSFLGSSASQLRRSSAFFVEGNFDIAQAIRNKLLPNMDPRASIAKYLSRLSLFATTDYPTVVVDKSLWTCIPDLEDCNGLSLTDGCGLIDVELAKEIFGWYPGNQSDGTLPCALQVRIAGIKGTLVVSHELKKKTGKLIAYRPSMKKVDNDHCTLGIVSVSRFLPTRLNRESITLLEALSVHSDWQFGSYLSQLQDQELMKQASILIDTTKALEALGRYFPNIKKFAPHVVLTEPYWWSLLRSIYQKSVHMLRSKTHIPVAKGALLMGICDPTSTLKPDQVFVQIRRNNSEVRELITGPVLVFRNPCLHPGDLRIVQAVSTPQLIGDFENVIIFPVDQTGHSIPAACSGGDLDGDLYHVIWDPCLVPPKNLEHEAMNYDLVIKEATEKYEDIPAQTMEDFFGHVTMNDTLGRVAHIHLALSDMTPDGAKDPLCIELAKSQSLAVDFPKTGIPPSVPELALKTVKTNGYPDFMEKPEKESYVSEKLLGKLFRQCTSITSNLVITSGNFSESDGWVSKFAYGSYKRYLKEAKVSYENYVCSMRQIMAHYGVKNEAEVILGDVAIHYHPFLKNKGKVEQELRNSWKHLTEKTREEFFQEFDVGSVDEEAMKSKVSAWAIVAYTSNTKKRKENFCSFPWTITDVFVKVLESSKEPINTAYHLIGRDCIELLNENSASLLGTLMSKMVPFNQVKTLLSENGCVSSVYGSVGMYLCEVDSDTDIFVNLNNFEVPGMNNSELTPKEKEVHCLQTFISPLLSKICQTKTEIFQARVPIIKCTMGEDEICSVDVCMNPEGLAKAKYIHQLYRSSPIIYPLFYVLTRWASSVGIIKSTISRNDGILKTCEFQALIFSLLKLEARKDTEEMMSFEELLEKARMASNSEIEELGKLLVRFFEQGSQLKGKKEFRWPVGDQQEHIIEETVVTSLGRHFQRGYHLLVQSRSWSFVIHQASSLSTDAQPTLEWKLPHHVSHHLSAAVEFHVGRLKVITGLKTLSLVNDGGGGSRLLLTAQGTRCELQQLRDEVAKLCDLGQLIGIGSTQIRSSAYFMQGATLLYTRGTSDQDCVLAFEPYVGPCNNSHLLLERANPVLRSLRVTEWKNAFIDIFTRRVIQQMSSMSSTSVALDSLTLSVRFGNFYVLSSSAATERSGGRITVKELELILAKNKSSRKKFEREEFTPKTKPEEEKEKFEMTQLKVAFSESSGISSQPTKSKPKRQKRHINLGCSFFSSVYDSENFTKNSTKFSEVETIFRNLGFHATPSTNTKCISMEYVPSRSYTYKLNFTRDMEISSVHERPLTWVHGTLLSGESPSKKKNGGLQHHDVRLKFTTRDDFPNSSPIFRDLFLETENSPFVLDLSVPSAPIIRLSKKLSPTAIHKIRFVRYRESKSEFFHAETGLLGKIVTGWSFEGKDLATRTPFLDVSLSVVKPEIVINWIKTRVGTLGMKEWIRSVILKVLEVSEALNGLHS